MATVKLATLVIRTLAKPISSSLKQQARTREPFRKLCVSLAQTMHRAEVNLRLNLLGQPHKAIRPLNEAAAIENGANALAEGFLFTVAAALVIAESWRSSRSNSKRRDVVDEELEELKNKVDDLRLNLQAVVGVWEDRWVEERQRNEELIRILDTLLGVKLRDSWSELDETPLRIPQLRLLPPSNQVDSTTEKDKDINK